MREAESAQMWRKKMRIEIVIKSSKPKTIVCTCLFLLLIFAFASFFLLFELAFPARFHCFASNI